MTTTTDTTPTYYKVLGTDGAPHHCGTGRWHLPTRARPGKWMPPIATLVACERGYHMCAGARDLLWWLGPTIYTVEIRGQTLR